MSDIHIPSPHIESDSLFPGLINLRSRRRRAAAYDAIRLTVKQAYEETVSFIANHWSVQGKWDMLLRLGDLTSGFRERGIADGMEKGSMHSLALRAHLRFAELSRDTAECWGNHDVGYGAEGISLESLSACGAISPLWREVVMGNISFVCICSPLLNADAKPDSEIARFQGLQEEGVRKIMKNLKGRRWVLCSHEYDVSRLEPVLAPHMDSYAGMLYGDLHSPLIGNLPRRLHILRRSQFMDQCLGASIFCPSVAPLWWRGGRMLVGEVRGVRLRLTQQRIPFTAELQQMIRALPVSNRYKATGWLLAAHAQRLASGL